MHLFRLNHREGDEAVKASPVVPILIPTRLLHISHHLYCLLFYRSIPLPASMPKDQSFPSEEAQAFLSSCPKSLLLPLLPSKIVSFVHPGKPTSSSLRMSHKWHNRWRGMILWQFQCSWRQVGMGGQSPFSHCL